MRFQKQKKINFHVVTKSSPEGVMSKEPQSSCLGTYTNAGGGVMRFQMLFSPSSKLIPQCSKFRLVLVGEREECPQGEGGLSSC